MIEYGLAQFPLFLFTAALLALNPGSGIAYVVAMNTIRPS